MDTRLLLDVLTSGDRHSIYDANMYLTCKLLYKKWPEVRDSVLARMIHSHADEHLDDYVAVEGYEIIQWGDLQLYMYKEAGNRLYSLCGELGNECTGDCCNAYCQVLKVIHTPAIITIGNVETTELIKYDIINELRYTIRTSSDYSTAIQQLYDCSLLPNSHRYMNITIESYTIIARRRHWYTVYDGYLGIYTAADDSQNTIDSKRIVCHIPTASDRYSTEVIVFINNNMAAIIQYMRSTHVIDSLQCFKQPPQCMISQRF